MKIFFSYFLFSIVFLFALKTSSVLGAVSEPGALLEEKSNNSPEFDAWQRQLMFQARSEWLQTQIWTTQQIGAQRIASKKKVIADRVEGFKNADALERADMDYAVIAENMVTPISGNDGLSVAAVKWNDAEQTSPVVWLFIFGIVAALALLVGVIMWERRRLRQKLERLKTTRMLQLELVHAHIMAIKKESSKTS